MVFHYRHQLTVKQSLPMRNKIILESICFLFILLFLYAAITKVLDYDMFISQIGRSPLLSKFAHWIAWMIPTIEVILSILLMVPRYRLFALFGSFTLMVIFTFYIIAILNFSKDIPCSCGGILEKLGWTEHIVFNIVFSILGALGILLQAKDEKTSVTGHPATAGN